ncbi:MAG: single-stranded DNA-binding protein [Acidimicrobiales bacterium]
MPDNTITLIGNLTRDPELRFTNSGQAQATLGLAVNRRWQNRQSGAWEERTSFFNVVLWGDLGENVAHSLPKGCRVIVTGRLEQRSWETENGERRSVVEVIADEIGPSLRWATAKVDKNERKTGGEFGGGPGGGAPSGGGPGGGAPSGGGPGGGSPPAGQGGAPGGTPDAGTPSFSDDEEPF